MRARRVRRITAVALAGLLAAACSGGGSDDESGSPEDVTTTTRAGESAPDAAPVVDPACGRLSADAVSFAAGEEFVADIDSATGRTCSYRRTAVAGDLITLSLSEAGLDPSVQLDALAASPASSATFRRVDLGDGAFFAEIDGKPRAGVFVDGELVELVVAASQPLGSANPVDEVLLRLLGQLTSS